MLRADVEYNMIGWRLQRLPNDAIHLKESCNSLICMRIGSEYRYLRCFCDAEYDMTGQKRQEAFQMMLCLSR